MIIFVFFKYQNLKVSNFIPAVQEKIQEVGELSQNRKLPELSDPVVKNYNWKYKGINYKISQTLYGSVYDFYLNQPKDYKYFGTLDNNWEEKYYAMFLKNSFGDETIINLTNEIVSQGKNHKLNEDQIVELVLAFVQSIPYDDEKARLILSGSSEIKVEYPYETLYTNSGVCSDKSFLATKMLRSLGYGTAIFTYDKENHMAIGIACPQQYSTYGSGYCYAETTSIGNKIGIIPGLDGLNNKASALLSENMEDFQGSTEKQLGDVKIYQASNGKTYNGIVATIAVMKEIENLKIEISKIAAELSREKAFIEKQQNQLEKLKNELEKYKKAEDIENYNLNVKNFNAILEANKKQVTDYNKKVILYNQKVKRYNALLQE